MYGDYTVDVIEQDGYVRLEKMTYSDGFYNYWIMRNKMLLVIKDTLGEALDAFREYVDIERRYKSSKED